MLFSEFISPNLRGVYSSLMNYFVGIGGLTTNCLQLALFNQQKIFYLIFFPSIVSGVFSTLVCLFVKESQNVKQTAKAEKNVKLESIWQRKYAKCFVIALALGCSTPGSGINSIMNYSTITFKSLFDSPTSAAYGGVIIQAIVAISASVSLFFVRKINRKTLILVGVIGMLLGQTFLIVVDLAVKTLPTLWFVISGSVLFIFSQQMSYGPLCFVLAAEVYPTIVKTRFVNITMVMFWFVIIVLTFIYPLLQYSANYSIYVVLTLLSGTILLKFLPETR